MKHMKKLVTLLLALIMALALVVPASAYTVDNKTDHAYRTYRSLAVHRVPKVNQLWGMSSGVTASRVLNF